MKARSSLKFRFMLLFTLFIIAISLITAIFGLFETMKVTSFIFAKQGVSVTEAAASLVDGDSFEKLARTLNKNDSFYIETQKRLLDYKLLSSCEYLYTMSPRSSTEWMYIIDGSTTPDDSENFSPLGTIVELVASDYAMLLAWKTGQTQSGRIVYYKEYGWLVSVFTPIKNSTGTIVGLAGCDFNANELMHSMLMNAIRQIIISALSIAAGIVLIFIFLRIIFGRLGKVSAILKEISTGEGDLTKRITILRNDEIGELANYFNLTLDKISNLIAVIKNRAAELYNIGCELADTMEQTAAAAAGINGNIQDVRDKTDKQSGSVAKTNAAMEQVTGSIGKLSRTVDDQTSSVSQSSTAIEQMLANIKNVTETLVRNAGNVKGLIDVSDVGRAGLQGVSQEVLEIVRESEGLLEINSVMENIASQTNLLSMNAAIEAAHAGDLGKGFAVVAGEIRKLAENSGNQSKTISEVLKKIKTAIDKITVSTNAVLEKFQSIDERVHTVSEQESGIRSAMEEQSQGSRQVLDAMGRLNEITRMVKEDSEKMLDGSKAVITESHNLELSTGEISASVDEMSHSAGLINTAVTRVSNIINANKEHINTLFDEISKFKIE
jgi:methyl-accepting chemotaxis protein